MDELKTAIYAVKEAEKIVNELWGSSCNLKEDTSPITAADTLTEELIRKLIKEEFPSHGFLGEEGGSSGDSDYTWIIDPIDGTLFYTRGMNYFSTLVSLMHKDEIILGVSNAPKIGEFMYAKKGKGAFLNDKKIKVSKVSKLNESLIFHGSVASFSKIGKLKNLDELSWNVWRARGYGNLIGSHEVAKGNVEAFIGASLRIWDVAALAIIITEAGGKATDLLGDKLNAKSTSALLSNGHIHHNILSAFNK